MNAFCVSPEILSISLLLGSDSSAEMIVMMLVQRVECLGVWVPGDKIIQMLGLAQPWMLRTSRGMMMRGERRWKVRWLKI